MGPLHSISLDSGLSVRTHGLWDIISHWACLGLVSLCSISWENNKRTSCLFGRKSSSGWRRDTEKNRWTAEEISRKSLMGVCLWNTNAVSRGHSQNQYTMVPKGIQPRGKGAPIAPLLGAGLKKHLFSGTSVCHAQKQNGLGCEKRVFPQGSGCWQLKSAWARYSGSAQGLQAEPKGFCYRAFRVELTLLPAIILAICCHCVFSTTRNNFLLYNIHVQQSTLISSCTSITETECNIVVVESGSKIKSKENVRESFTDKDFSSKSIPITTTHSWYSFRYKILKVLLYSFV